MNTLRFLPALHRSAVALVLAALTGGCAEPVAPEPVAKLTLASRDLELPYPEWRSLRLEWNPLRALEKTSEISVFVHLLDGDGSLLRTFDHPLPGPWNPGEPLSHEIQLYQSVLGAPLNPGEYSLTMGLYGRDGNRWPLAVDGEDLGRYEYSVATVAVPPISPEAPAFTFTHGWADIESGSDSQILARRWLSRDSTVLIQNLEVPGSLWLQLNVPPPGSAEPLQALDAAAPPSFDVSCNCSGAVRSFRPPGVHQLVVPVFPAEDGTDCALQLIPSFLRPPSNGPTEALAALEILAWSPAEL